MKDFVAPDWQRVFEFNGLRSFEDFWTWKAEWFEAPNERRGGWSGVARCELKLPQGGTARVFLKRQEKHITRTLVHPFRGIPTFVREYRNIVRYQRHGIPSLTPLYFACRGWRAVLLTEELVGFQSLGEIAKNWETAPPSLALRHAVIRETARLLRQMHDRGLRHNCFYPKHVFLRIDPHGGVEARVIDLEKTKWRPSWWPNTFRDLRTLQRTTLNSRRTDRLRFLMEYLGVPGLTPRVRSVWRRVSEEQRKKDAAQREQMVGSAAAVGQNRAVS